MSTVDRIEKQIQARIVRGNTFSSDGFIKEKFEYGVANPSFGAERKKVVEGAAC